MHSNNTKSNLQTSIWLRACSPPKTVTWNSSPQVKVYQFEGNGLRPVKPQSCVPRYSGFNSLQNTLPRQMAISSSLSYYQNGYY